MLNDPRILSRWFVCKETLRNLAKHNGQHRPVLVLSLRRLRQRYLYLMVRSLIQAGYFVHLDLDISKETFWNTDGYARYVFEEPHLRSVTSMPGNRAQAILCLDHDGVDVAGWKKVIRVDYDILEGLHRPGAIIVPYWMHPNVYRSYFAGTVHYWRHYPKSVRMFFAGNISRRRYGQRSRLHGNKLTRADILDAIVQEFPQHALVVDHPDELRSIITVGYHPGLLVFDATKSRLGREDWFPCLCRCEYFLALPGVVMPVSHNIVEAMALGCVPVCNYPEWFSPRLVHGENVLTFDDLESLGQAVETVLHADPATTLRLRAGALDYYDAYHDAPSFMDQALRTPGRVATIYVNAEEVSALAGAV